jgi:hypothetical protein
LKAKFIWSAKHAALTPDGPAELSINFAYRETVSPHAGDPLSFQQ